MTTIADAQRFTAGSGDEFLLVTLPDSDNVVVFRRFDDKWVGHCQFNRHDSSGLAPSEIQPAINKQVGPHPNGSTYVCRECRSQLGGPHKLDCSRGGAHR